MKLADAAARLGVEFPPENTPEYRAKLKTAWRRAAKQNHPDANPADPEASGRFAEVNRAHQAIVDFLDGKTESTDDDAGAPDESDTILDLLEQVSAIIAALRMTHAELAATRADLADLRADVDELFEFAEVTQLDIGAIRRRLAQSQAQAQAQTARQVQPRAEGIRPRTPPNLTSEGPKKSTATAEEAMMRALRGLDVLVDSARAMRKRR